MDPVNHSADPSWILSLNDLLIVNFLVLAALLATAWVAWRVYLAVRLRRAMSELRASGEEDALTPSETRVVNAVTALVGEQMRLLAREIAVEIGSAIAEHDQRLEGLEQRLDRMIIEAHETSQSIHSLDEALRTTADDLRTSMADLVMRGRRPASAGH